MKVIKENLFFLAPYLLIMILAGIVLVIVPKLQIHIFINQFHSSFFDYFFRYITTLGSGLFAVIAGLLLLFRRIRVGIFIIAANAIAGLIVQILKRIVFNEMHRPVLSFEGIYPLHLIDRVAIRMHFSFPSGHAATAFALFFCLAAITRNKALKFLCFIMAVCVAFSRVYLSQHFLIDIYAGSVIGVVVSLIFYYIIYKKNTPQMDKNLLQVIRQKK
jgi:membrane-associated phospholipid phosphatase